LIIYAIINYKNNNKLNNFIESYQNDAFNAFNKDFKLDIYNNTLISVDFANGTWTIPESIVNNDYTITNLMTIKINNDADIKNSSNYTNTYTYNGFKQQIFNFGTIDYNGEKYTINYVVNENYYPRWWGRYTNSRRNAYQTKTYGRNRWKAYCLASYEHLCAIRV
jgi:hypothetical protein